VIQEFSDYDNILHEVGERWTFYETCFEPVDKELILFIQYDDEKKGIFRMNLLNEKQIMIVENFNLYIKKIKVAI